MNIHGLKMQKTATTKYFQHLKDKRKENSDEGKSVMGKIHRLNNEIKERRKVKKK